MIRGKITRLRSKKIEDSDNDYRWQTDPELSDLDAITPLSMSFSDYIIEYRDMLRHPSEYRRPLGVDTVDGKHIGNCVWYNIDKVGREAEVGIMIGDRDYWNKGYGTDAMKAIVDYIFHDLRAGLLRAGNNNRRGAVFERGSRVARFILEPQVLQAEFLRETRQPETGVPPAAWSGVESPSGSFTGRSGR